MKALYLLTFSLLLFTSCSRYPGYRKLTPDIYYSLLQIGEQKKKAFVGDYLTLNLVYRTQKDSVFFKGIRKVKLYKPESSKSIDWCFMKMNVGDSASFILSADDFFQITLKRELPDFISGGEVIRIDIRLLEIQSEKEFRDEKELFLLWSAELSEYEHKVLMSYLEEESPGIKPKPEGFYIMPTRNGNGRKVKKGDHVWVNYEGKFLNGKFFDGTYRSHQPVDFIYGTQLVLISGLDHALGYMSEGESAMVILPSDLAFGDKGDTFGIIPPYTSLIYTLEIVKIE